MTISNIHGAGPEQWDLLIDRWVSRISDLACKQPLSKWSIVAKTNLIGQQL
jgi:hypothetical protein